MKKSKYESEYKPALKSIIVNKDDADLKPVKIPLPDCPPLNKIAGYGLPSKEQKFKRPEEPHQLKELSQRKDIETVEEIWDILEENQEIYNESIEYINQMWEYRLNGMWFFNNGVPTYITGTHFFYLTSWHLDSGLPDYRSRDVKFFMFLEFSKKDPNALGMTYPKHRREGATSKTQCALYEAISRQYNAHGGIQSMTEQHAAGVFQDHLVNGWKKVPFFFRPVDEGASNPKKVLRFALPPRRSIKGSILNRDKVLDSYIDYGPSNIGAYDTYKLMFYHSDECGKTTEVSVYQRHNVVKQCLTLGRKYVGFCIYTSTVGEMDKGGGKEFMKICNQSHYDHWKEDFKRNKNNRTASGMYLLFIPAYDGLEGFIDEFGNSVIEDPEKPVVGLDGELIEIGAKTYLKNAREDLLDKNDVEGYSEITRMYPISYRECFRVGADKCKFNVKILEDRLDEFSFGNDHITTGNFEWKDGVTDSEVIWVPSKTGKFKVSRLLPKEQANSYYTNEFGKMPGNADRFISGGDPFKFKETRQGNKSNGGGATFQLRDPNRDDADKPIDEWTTNRFCCTYSHRPPTKTEYGEDMIMMCVYYGSMMNAEINVPFLWEYFEERGYSNYLWYQTDPKTGYYKNTPGTNTNGAVKDDIYREYHTYIERHGHREVHDEILRECYEIDEDMGDYDLFVAGGLCLTAAKAEAIYGTTTKRDEDADLGSYIKQFTIK